MAICSQYIQNFTMTSGDSKRLRFPVWADDDNTVRKNLTGALSVKWQMNDLVPSDPASVVIVAQKGLGTGLSVVFDQDAVNGDILVVLDPDDTEDLPAAYNYHEVEVVDVAGDKITVASGTVTMRADAIV